MKVPFLRDREIERAATVLLERFCRADGRSRSLPVPVEALLEKHLQLTLGFDDLHTRFGVPQTGEEPDVLGALLVLNREVLIHEALDPDTAPWQEGRYRFTLGHEVGHWDLHRDLVAGPVGQGNLFDPSEPVPIVCRSSERSQPIERQADRFAAALLMPRDLVVDVWGGVFGDAHARSITDLDDPHVYMRAMRALSREFKVSVEAMRIRCEQLGLLYRTPPEQRMLRPAS
ncbi:MAG: ImmA/IrrE family metallo-endopeptidase [Acidimicrobiia bacterium]|nr:ImmA/IrrE family metallo-endopeptidase [Acidimicrobiia bacterium]